MKKITATLCAFLLLPISIKAVESESTLEERRYYANQLDRAKFEMFAYIMDHKMATSAIIATGGGLAAFLQDNMDQDTKSAVVIIGILGLGYCLNSSENAEECAKVTAELTSYATKINVLQKKISSFNALSAGDSTYSGAFKVTNNCSHPVKVAIHFRDLNNNWTSDGWWNIKGNTSSYLVDSANNRLKTTATTWYYYAETIDDTGIIWKGEKAVQLLFCKRS